MLSPFSPYASILGLPIDDVPVVEGNMQYFDAPGDFFLAYDVAALRSCVVDSNGSRLTEWRWNPGYAVSDLKEVVQSNK
jgi:hypothetical protein